MRNALIMLGLILMAGCNLANNGQEVITYDEILAELVAIDEKHDTSLWNESISDRLSIERIQEIRVDVIELKNRVATATSPTEKEYVTVSNLVDARLHLLETQEEFHNYRNAVIKKKCPEDAVEMHNGLVLFSSAINETIAATRAWDRALNNHKPALEELAKQRQRPAFTATPIWKYQQELSETRAALNTFCPLGIDKDQPHQVCYDDGTCIVFGEPPEDEENATVIR